ncbi:MAG: Porphobilinogen deaminase [Anaerosporomusa subterranea]|jgi:hydroxymethylbilane synthase|nr:Porphobilinogen deaminase [Anaerosporomusa subterranea]
MMKTQITNQLVIGARGSKLSLWQANHIADLLRAAHPQLEVSIKTFVTKGDKFLDAPLAKIGGKGLFTKEIETAMLLGEVDLAVHSLKDMPAELPPGLMIAAVTKRHDPNDAFISNTYASLECLPQGAKLGTSSLRRKAQILSKRTDLNIEDLRGNVDTRLRKLDNGEYDAIVLAVAGLKRLGLGGRITQVLPREICLPAVGQGALAIETRSDDATIQDLVACLEDNATRQAITAERAYLQVLEGGCQIPVGVFGQIVGGELKLQAVILSLDGTKKISDVIYGNCDDAAVLGRELADRMLAAGGSNLLAVLAKASEEE